MKLSENELIQKRAGKIKDNHKNKVDVSILSTQRIYAPDVLSEMVTNYKIMYPERKVKYAILNNNIHEMIEYVMIIVIPKALDLNGTKVDAWLTNVAVRGSSTSLLTYNYIKDFGPEYIENFFIDLNNDCNVGDFEKFEHFLNDIEFKRKIPENKEIVLPNGKKEIRQEVVNYSGLTTDKKSPMFFILPENLPAFFKYIYNYKTMFDNARKGAGLV